MKENKELKTPSTPLSIFEINQLSASEQDAYLQGMTVAYHSVYAAVQQNLEAMLRGVQVTNRVPHPAEVLTLTTRLLNLFIEDNYRFRECLLNDGPEGLNNLLKLLTTPVENNLVN